MYMRKLLLIDCMKKPDLTDLLSKVIWVHQRQIGNCVGLIMPCFTFHLCLRIFLPCLPNLTHYISVILPLNTKHRNLDKNLILVLFLMRKLPKTSMFSFKVRKKANIRNRCNHVPHLTQDTAWDSDKT